MSDWLREADFLLGLQSAFSLLRTKWGLDLLALLADSSGKMLFFWMTTKRHALTHSESHLRGCFMRTHCDDTVRREIPDVPASASKSDNKLTTRTLSRTEYFTSVRKLSLYYVFSPLCLCVEFHQASEEGGWVIALRKPTQWVEPPTHTHVHPQNSGQQTTFQYLSATEQHYMHKHSNQARHTLQIPL